VTSACVGWFGYRQEDICMNDGRTAFHTMTLTRKREVPAQLIAFLTTPILAIAITTIMSSAHLLEKGELLPPAASVDAATPTPTKKKVVYRRWLKRVFWTYMAVSFAWEVYSVKSFFNTFNDPPACPQASALAPQKNADLWDAVNRKIGSPAFKGNAVEWLSGAVKVP
jgi:hypothetical protein